jgi:hypothetical protein
MIGKQNGQGERKMDSEAKRTTVEAMIAGLGKGMGGACVYTGTRKIIADYEAPAIFLLVNGKRGQGWKIMVSYDEAQDLFNVSMMDKFGKDLHEQLKEVYIDDLRGTVEGIYDAAIQKHNGGFIDIN